MAMRSLFVVIVSQNIIVATVRNCNIEPPEKDLESKVWKHISALPPILKFHLFKSKD